MQFQFGREKQADKTIVGDEKKLLLVFTDNSGSVDKNRGAYRQKFYNIVLGFFNELVTSYVKSKTSIAVETYVFDAYAAQMDAYHWVGDKRQNSNFILSYKKIPRKKTYGTSINEVYRTALRMIDEHAVTCPDFKTYIMIVCDGGTEDYGGAPEINVWLADMKQLVSRLRAKNVVFLLVGASDIEPNDRPKLPGQGKSMYTGKPYLQIHEEMWSRYPLAKGFYGRGEEQLQTDIRWFVQKLNS
jgi:hypothetical protein